MLLIACLAFVAVSCGDSTGRGDNAGGSAGSAQAGAAAGGASTGGASTGGASTGGASTGGASTGGTASQGGSSGNAGSGGAGAGGVAGGSGGNSAGTGGGAGAGGIPVSGQHCEGGDVLTYPDEVFADFGGPMSNCNSYTTGPSGIQPGVELSVRDIALATPLSANQPYAFSIKVTAAPTDEANTIELWSADDLCGEGKEKLYEGEMKVGILCVELAPTANRARLLMAWKGEGTRGSTDIALCPAGTCEQ